jgi:hypothetical protein
MSRSWRCFLPKVIALVRAIVRRGSGKQVLVFLEIIPSKIRDIVSKPLNDIPHIRSREYDASGYKSIYDAVINAQHVGSRVVLYVKPENLLFCFGESVESLQASVRRFCRRLGVFYSRIDFYAPIYNEKNARKHKSYGEPWAIIVCKVININHFQPFIRDKKKKTCGNCECYEITWSELQNLQNRLSVVSSHSDSSVQNSTKLTLDNSKDLL